ncbi:MAG TPA: lamin tail domain-containing protein, partial [Planctomycetota bacterium]|nr:lamin tail domain-containing protein [Planctomycetota bacterium]
MIGTCRSAALVLFLASPLQASWVVISEVHYHPREGDALEFVEIFTRDPPRVDLTGWTLEGDVEHTFARGASLLPGEALVIARDPAALRARHPGLEHAAGPFSGALGDRGGRLTLRNAAGVVVSEVRYKNGDKWPAAAGGTGHTLLLRDPLLDPRDPRSWIASPRPGGSPGAAPEYAMPSREPGTPIVRKGETWSFFRGTSEPPRGWQALDFDDASWEAGPSGFGYSDDDDATVLEDMPGNYLAVYTRKTFRVEDPSRLARLLLLVSYDDGFIASLNGREVARENLGPPGTAVTHETPASATHEAGVPVERDLGPASSLLRPGKNVLAVQCHNRSLSSTDLSLIVELESWAPPPSASNRRSGPELLLNEVLPGSEGFVEIHNPAGEDADLAGWFLTDDPADLKRFPIRPGSRVPARGFRALAAREIGERLALRGPEAFLALVAPDGPRVVDAVRIAPGEAGLPAEAQGLSIGRLPDGAEGMVLLDRRTPGAPNRVAARGLVLSEVHYHPLPDDPAAEFIEIHNPTAARVSLEGHRIQGAVRFRFLPGEGVDPGGYLVVAKDPAVLTGARGLEPRRVAGPFEGRLGDRGESLRLVDPRGVAVDALDYADRDPWPRGADGGGSSLERVHPGLDGSFPGAWAASDETSRSVWRDFHYEVELRSVRGRSFPDVELILLEAGECLIDDLLVKEGARPRASRTLLDERFESAAGKWRAEGNHEDSRRVPDPDDPDRGCYRLRSTGRGNTRHNLAWAPLRQAAAPGGTYVVSFRARWLAGSPRLLTRLGGNGLARVHDLVVPPGGGTPGAVNSRHDPAAGPVVAAPVQEPVLPSESEPVMFTVRAAGLAPIASVAIEYRRDGEADWRAAPLSDDGKGADPIAGDGIHSGIVPPLPAGIVEFFVRAVDADGCTGVYPSGAPGRTALYAVGLRPAPSFPSYTLLVPARTWREMERQPSLSNRLHEATLVIGSSRIFHQVGFRPRGSPFTRKLQNNWKVVFGAETLDGRRSLILDRQDGSA